MTAPRIVVFPSELRRLLCTWASDDRAREACGVLVGERTGDTLVIRRVTRARNLSTVPAEFVCDPGAIVAAENTAHAEGLEVVGFWHSHLHGSAIPSSSDAAGEWPDCVTAVVCPDHSPTVRTWFCGHGSSVEIQLVASMTCATRLATHNHPVQQSASTESP